MRGLSWMYTAYDWGHQKVSSAMVSHPKPFAHALLMGLGLATMTVGFQAATEPTKEEPDTKTESEVKPTTKSIGAFVKSVSDRIKFWTAITVWVVLACLVCFAIGVFV